MTNIPTGTKFNFYAYAENPKGKIEAMLVTRLKTETGGSRQVSQEWTGVTFRSMKEAHVEIGRLNVEIAESLKSRFA